MSLQDDIGPPDELPGTAVSAIHEELDDLFTDDRPTPSRINLGCGTDQRAGYCNVDEVASVDPDIRHDLDDYPWPFQSQCAERILASHVLEHLSDVERALTECARILEPGGQLVVRHPIGLDHVADPDHEPDTRWDWTTPEMYCGERHWDVDVGLEVVDKRVRLWSQEPGWLGRLKRAYYEYLLHRYGPGRWCFNRPATSGEFIVTFERGDDS